jgi:hypothetical protein
MRPAHARSPTRSPQAQRARSSGTAPGHSADDPPTATGMSTTHVDTLLLIRNGRLARGRALTRGSFGRSRVSASCVEQLFRIQWRQICDGLWGQANPTAADRSGCDRC